MRLAVNLLSPAAMTETDSKIARAVRHLLEWDFFVPDGWVQATVSGGVVSLQGRVEFHREWGAIQRAVARIRGVREVRLPQILNVERRQSNQAQPRCAG